ncbi:hypothetical protein K450DRAFT_244440 [Umbelopsis ramanniana AG]|uniref:Uncharacterized protein n=1 Tax=Umbelopsis ramanniana AG TaxID=1314678 RepID=A0AAD5HDI0_UMBRA|nr:uncharacterized protein K450DRAFT_244440 [Umbelopsis ramanniana AG]KAI8578984.1 hypothetical protein K450DRAFT_244440 [Umbelopsis ramanniana AG]
MKRQSSNLPTMVRATRAGRYSHSGTGKVWLVEPLEIQAHEPELFGGLVLLAQGFVACFHFFPSCSRHIMGPFVYPETLFSTNNRSHYFRSPSLR